MKIKWNEKYTTISVYSFIVICLSIVFYHIVSEFSSFKINLSKATSVLQPFLIGFVIAYLLNFILKIIEEKGMSHFPSLKPKAKRFLSLFLTYLVVAMFVYIFITFVFPQLTNSLMGLMHNIPSYINKVSDLLEDKPAREFINDEYFEMIINRLSQPLSQIMNLATELIPRLGDILKKVASSVSNIALGFVISIYLLLDKENFFGLGRKITAAVFSKRVSDKILSFLDRSNTIFGKFISGKLLDSFIVGWITFFLLTIFKIPYVTLVSFIIGLTNIIPFFGPFIGALPSFLIILFISPAKAVWFLVIVLFIQQLDGNIIGPKILGDSLGISAFWILFSLLVGSKLLGVVGMIIGVPLFAIFYSIAKDTIESRLKRKNLPTETKEYMK